MFVTAAGSPHSRLLRALERGNLELVRLAAVECARIDLEDALRILLLIRDQDPDRYERAAVRWSGRMLASRPTVGFARAGEILANAEHLASPDGAVAAARLALVMRACGEPRLAEILERS